MERKKKEGKQRACHGNLTTEEKGLKRVFGVEKATAIVGGAARGETADRCHDKRQ